MRTFIFCGLALLFCTVVFAADERLHPAAPSELANTSADMKTPGFWISRHPSPDAIVMTPDKIAAFNARIQNEQKLTKDIFKVITDLKTDSLATTFDKTFKEIKDKAYYDSKGVKGSGELSEKIYRNINLPGVVMGVAPRYGLITRYADQRFFPTAEGLYEQADDLDFDQLQNSTLDVGTPVAVVHQSLDKKWVYVLSADSDGWVKAADVAVGDMKTVQDYAAAQNFAVAVVPKADIFADKARTQWLAYVRMGTRLPIQSLSFPNASVGNPEEGDVSGSDSVVEVKVPVPDKEGRLSFTSAYMNTEDVNDGYLPFTPRTVIKQAFRMLNVPYGWGGMYGEQDCSAFMQEIFSTVGVHLPRDSKNQALTGREIVVFDDKVTEKEKTGPLSTASAGITLLPMKGHIMLYLGTVDGRPYAIHEIWAYRQDGGDKDILRVLNRVTVSDLYLGQGSRKGSLLRRLSAIREIRE